MTKKQTTDKTAKPKPAPKRIEIEHPKMKGNARVWKKDIDAWLGKGWRQVQSAGSAD